MNKNDLHVFNSVIADLDHAIYFFKQNPEVALNHLKIAKQRLDEIMPLSERNKEWNKS